MNPSSQEQLYDRFCLRQPPILDQELARRHWRQINRMFHSMIVLHEAARYRKPFEPIVETARDILSARCGLLFVRSPRGARLELRAHSGLCGPIHLFHQPVNRLARAAFFHKKPILVDRGSGIAPENDLLLRQSASVVAVPVRSRGVPWGVLQLGSDRVMSQGEAVLLWMYALMVESALPAFSNLTREAQVDGEEILEEKSVIVPAIDLELLYSTLNGETSSLLRLGWRAPGESVPLSSNADAVRLIRRSLRPIDNVMKCDNGDLLITLPALNGSQSWALARSLRRSLLQSTCLGETGVAMKYLRIANVTSPVDGGGPDELIRILESRLKTAPDARSPSSSVVAWKWNVP